MIGQRVFSGGVFSDALDDGRAGAEIELSPDGVFARTPDGDVFLIPYRECQLEIGGYSGRMVFCRNEDQSLTIFCEDRKFPQEMSLASGGLLNHQLGDKLKKRRSEAWRGRSFGTALLVIAVVLLVAGYFGIRIGARAAVRALPVSIDVKIGSTVFQSMDLGGPEIEDEVVVEAMQAMVDRMAPHAKIEGLEFEVHVVDSPVINAFALPGGTMVVYTGLIEKASDPEQVAGVLAHEMAHATLRHGIQRIGQSLGLAAALNFLLGDMQGLIAAGAELFQLATINSYSRTQESAADEEGVRMLYEAGIDPLALGRFFELLKQEQGNLPEVPSWLSTHPQHDVRILEVRQHAGRLPPREHQPLDIDWADVQRRIKQQ